MYVIVQGSTHYFFSRGKFLALLTEIGHGKVVYADKLTHHVLPPGTPMTNDTIEKIVLEELGNWKKLGVA